jgi:hypothetical protein
MNTREDVADSGTFIRGDHHSRKSRVFLLLVVAILVGLTDVHGQRRNEFGPMDGKCRDACGADCPDTCDVDEYNECTEDGKSIRVVTRYQCGTHQGCRDHDDCLDACIAPYEYGNVPGTDFTLADIEFFVGPCQAECHLEALAYASELYPGEGPSTVHSWASGGGPYDGSDVWEYTRDRRDGPDRTEPCGECESCFGGACLPIDDCEPCNSCNDVHLYTLDGLKFDFQAAGEFTLLSDDSGSFVLQARQEPYSSGASVNTAVAMNVAGTRVGVYIPGTLRIDGTVVPVEVLQGVDLPGGGTVRRLQRAYMIAWPNGARVSVRLYRSHVNVGVVLPEEMRGKVKGILGNYDGDASNDLFSASRAQIEMPLTYESLYREYGDTWRISQQLSLFDYDSGKTTETYQLLDFPTRRVQLADLDEADREKAAEVCTAAGVQGDAQFDDCVFDVALTGDDVFAQNNVRSRTIVREVLRIEPDTSPAAMEAEPTNETARDQNETPRASDVVFSFQDDLYAGFDVEITLEGTTAENDFVTIVEAEAPDGELGLRSRVRDSRVTLQMPTTPGTYELRYVTAATPRETVARKRVEVLALDVQLDVPEAVEAGSEFEIVARGTLNPDDFITVVPAGSPDETLDSGARARIRSGVLGAGLKRTIRLTAPEETGEFEVRYVTNRSPRVSCASEQISIR